jgi:hypothetical protein
VAVHQLVVKAVGFVDDIRTSTNDFKNNSIPIDQLIGMATKDSQVWHDLLAVCNQKLELPKCGYHAIMYDFEPSGEPILVDQRASRITLGDGAGELVILSTSNSGLPQWQPNTWEHTNALRTRRNRSRR